ncbi:MAG: C40 family peptidase [Lachnospiraceae bacterium]|nr:C40 family peptidase [Lachnospiraceae bacterium]
MKKRVLPLLWALIFVLAAYGSDIAAIHAFADKISDLESEKEEIEKKKKEAADEKKKEEQALNSANEKASELSGDMESVESEIEEVDEELVATIAAVEIVKDEISAKEAEIEVTTREYEEAKATEEAQYEAMKLRIKYLYEKGDFTYMQMLMEAKSFSDLINKVEYVEKLYEYDRRLLLEYQEAKETTLELKLQLEEEKDELDADMAELEEEENYLNELLDAKKAEYDSYQAQYDNAVKEAEKFKASVQKKNEEIRKLEAEASAKQSEIDAEKKAEEERKAAEERERLASSGSSSMSSSGASSSAPESSSKSYSAATNFNSGSKGQDIANYALQFVGNPYVPGGTSLVSGCDCSGFVMRVYKDFGYTLPRTSTSMRSVGSEVSYENARAGDIVCYAGHVAIYLGGGQIVHASTQKTGIKTGSIFYKEFITIRRVV